MSNDRYVLTSPNQRIIERTVVPDEPPIKTPYAHYYDYIMDTVIKDLFPKSGAIVIWLWLARNDSSYHPALSPKMFKEQYGMGKSAYDSGVDELINKGYLIPNPKAKNRYTFYVLPERLKEEAMKRLRELPVIEDNISETSWGTTTKAFDESMTPSDDDDIRDLLDELSRR